MLKTKENKIIFFSVLVLACLVYINFITGYFSIDSSKIINLGYDGYAINYSFWDGRIVMGILCMIANAINLNLKVFYIILICLSMLILSFTVLKLYTVISKYKKTGVKEKIILAVLAFCYIFNFTTINSMEFVECIVMSLSILLYILVAENIVIKKDVKKVVLYTFLAGICYQGTINMLFITAILFFFLEYKKGEKIDKKKLIFSIIGVIIAVILNVVLKKVMEIIIGSTVCGERMSGDILGNITKIIQGMYFLIIESLYLFPKYAYISFNAISLLIIFIYCVKNKNIKIWYNAFFLFIMSIVSSFVLLIVFDGIQNGNGRVFGSIGASFSVLWIYVYIKTDIFKEKSLLKYLSVLVITCFMILNLYNTVEKSGILKESNNIEKELSLKITNEITRYEAETNEKIKYIKIKYQLAEARNLSPLVITRNSIITSTFDEKIIKIYTDKDLEKLFFEEEDLEKVKEEDVKCEKDTVYVLVD